MNSTPCKSPLCPQRIAAGVLAFTLAGCAVGPDFERPAPPAAAGYSASPLPQQTAAAPVAGGAAQRFLLGRDIPGDWWQLYRSPVLDALIRRALADSPSLEAAQAALRVSQENLRAASAVLYPRVDA
ncbi:MAG: TolC family protein, partial [Burkholderiales bacterium]